jgi:hypothetical protein
VRERLLTFLLAIAALALFYALFLRPPVQFDADASRARPTSEETRGNGFAAAWRWLRASGVRVHSLRERYDKLTTLAPAANGNLLILALPAMEQFRTEELQPLDRWVRSGNTLLIVAGVLDAPDWAKEFTQGAVADIEVLTGIEFETIEARNERLDDTPLATLAAAADARAAERAARAEEGKSSDDDSTDDESATEDAKEDSTFADRRHQQPRVSYWHTTGRHPLLDGVKRLQLASDFEPGDWALRLPFDDFVLSLARTDSAQRDALLVKHLDRGRVILALGGSLFANRSITAADNAKLFANLVAQSVGPSGVVLFDDLRQGLAASYDPARFYRDSRLHVTIAVLLGLWLVWVLGATRLRAAAAREPLPAESQLIEQAGQWLAQTVRPATAARTLVQRWFERLGARVGLPASQSAEQRLEWLARQGRLEPQDLDALRRWMSNYQCNRKRPLRELHNLLRKLDRQLPT